MSRLLDLPLMSLFKVSKCTRLCMHAEALAALSAASRVSLTETEPDGMTASTEHGWHLQGSEIHRSLRSKCMMRLSIQGQSDLRFLSLSDLKRAFTRTVDWRTNSSPVAAAERFNRWETGIHSIQNSGDLLCSASRDRNSSRPDAIRPESDS